MKNNTKIQLHIIDILSYLFLPFFIIMLLFFAVFRPSDFANDYANYLQLFDLFKLPSSIFGLNSIEPMYILLSKFVYIFDGGFLSLLLLLTSISIFLKYRYAKVLFIRPLYILLYFFIYFITFYPLYELTQLRICLALSFILYALIKKNCFSYIFFILLAVLSHYSLAPAAFLLLAIEVSKAKIKCSQVNFFIITLIVCVFIFVLWFLRYLPDKYEGTNYPFYYYFFHPFSFIVIALLVIFRKIALENYSRIFTNIYFVIFLYYVLFAAFIISGNQIPAFRFLEIALFFGFNLLCISIFLFKSKLSLLLLIVFISIIITFFHLVASNPLINFSVFRDYFSFSGV